MKRKESLFLNELKEKLREYMKQNSYNPQNMTFNRIYKEIQPTLEELRKKHNIQSNPINTNTTIIMVKAETDSHWYYENIFMKKRTKPLQILNEELEQLFRDNKLYTYPDGRTIDYWRGKHSLFNIKTDIIDEFGIHDGITIFDVKHLLNVVHKRFS